MTNPNDPNLSPFVPQVHDEQRSNQTVGLSQDSQRGMRGKFIESILQLVVQAITGIFLPGPLGSAFSQLTSWADGLFDMIREPLSALVDLLVVILDSIPIIGPPLGDVVEDLAALFGLLKDRDAVQQASADTANVGLAILNARVNGIIIGGASLYDTFDRNVTDIATDPAYDVEYFNGPGSMNLTTADSGVARWAAVGFSDAAFVARDVTTPMTTNIVRLSTVIGTFTYGDAGNQAHVKLMGRMDATRQNYVVGIIEGTVAEIGYVLAGVYTRMGAQVSVSTSSGDLWDFEVGTLGDEWQFRLLQNNAERVLRNDLGHASHKDTTPGTTYKWVAFGGDCAIVSGPFFTIVQAAMPDYQVFAAADF
jgi:hypothetical protein